jgi:hypothetical protein
MCGFCVCVCVCVCVHVRARSLVRVCACAHVRTDDVCINNWLNFFPVFLNFSDEAVFDISYPVSRLM